MIDNWFLCLVNHEGHIIEANMSIYVVHKSTIMRSLNAIAYILSDMLQL